MKENILLTVTMLVSDRKNTIEKCLKSLAHLLEAVPSELIVVDTAGNQACMDIVRQYTDKIVAFKWCDDFSAARNAGVEKAQGQWLMYLDDDEWFESTAELENFFLSGDFRRYHAAAYIQRNYEDSAGSRWNDADVIRIVKREKDTRFVRKIHEYLTPINNPVCYLQDYVHHYGYVYKSQEEKNRHLWRNIRLLLETHREMPEDTHTTAQLIQEYLSAGEYFSAIQSCREIWKRKDCWDTPFDARYATYAMITEERLYVMQKRYADGYATGREMLSQKGISVLAKGAVCDFMTEFCWRLGKYEETLEYIDTYFVCRKEWDQYSDKKTLDAFSECAKYMNSKEFFQLSMLRIHIRVLQKEWEKAEAALQAVDWQDEAIMYLMETPGDVITLLINGFCCPACVLALRTLYHEKEMRALLYSAIDNLKPEKRELLLPYLYQIPPEDVRLCSYHIIYAGKQENTDAAIPALEKMRQQGWPLFLEDEEYWDSLQKLNVDMNQYMPELSIYSWIETAKRLWALVSMETCEKAYVCLIRGMEKTDLRYPYLGALMTEKRLLAKTNQEEAWRLLPLSELWNRLSLLSQYWVSCAASLYREEVFMGELIGIIPPCYQFGWYMMQAGAVKEENLGLFLRKVADAAKAYPELKEPCKTIIEEYKSL